MTNLRPVKPVKRAHSPPRVPQKKLNDEEIYRLAIANHWAGTMTNQDGSAVLMEDGQGVSAIDSVGLRREVGIACCKTMNERLAKMRKAGFPVWGNTTCSLCNDFKREVRVWEKQEAEWKQKQLAYKQGPQA